MNKAVGIRQNGVLTHPIPCGGANCHKAKNKIPLKQALFSSPYFRRYKLAYPNGSMKTKMPEIRGFRAFLAL